MQLWTTWISLTHSFSQQRYLGQTFHFKTRKKKKSLKGSITRYKPYRNKRYIIHFVVQKYVVYVYRAVHSMIRLYIVVLYCFLLLKRQRQNKRDVLRHINKWTIGSENRRSDWLKIIWIWNKFVGWFYFDLVLCVSRAQPL